jgi:hypothetical protein
METVEDVKVRCACAKQALFLLNEIADLVEYLQQVRPWENRECPGCVETDATHCDPKGGPYSCDAEHLVRNLLSAHLHLDDYEGC